MMTKRKLFLLSLLLCLTLTACAAEDEQTSSNYEIPKSAYPTSLPSSDLPTNVSPGAKAAEFSVTFGTDFSNGTALVELSEIGLVLLSPDGSYLSCENVWGLNVKITDWPQKQLKTRFLLQYSDGRKGVSDGGGTVLFTEESLGGVTFLTNSIGKSGLLFVKKSSGNQTALGLVNCDGDWVDPLSAWHPLLQFSKLDVMEDLGEGMFRIQGPLSRDSGFYLYDSTTQEIHFVKGYLAAEEQYAPRFENGTACFPGYYEGTDGVFKLDKDGNLACILENVSYAGHFEDLFLLENGKAYDQNGTNVFSLPPSYVELVLHGSDNGCCLLQMTDKERRKYFTVIDKTGRPLFDPIPCYALGTLHEGLYLVTTYDEKTNTYSSSCWNTQGKKKFTLPSNSSSLALGPFQNGAARVEQKYYDGSNLFYINAKGEVIAGVPR